MPEALYIWNYPSNYGMGSNYETYLVTMDQIKHAMKSHLRRMHRHDSDTIDVDGLVEKYVQDSLTSCNTYAGVNDIIKVPDDVKVTNEKFTVNNAIFRVRNQFGFPRDIVVGEAVFYKKYLDLTEVDGLSSLEGKMIYEFTSFKFKRVLENHLSSLDMVDNVLLMLSDRTRRIKEKTHNKGIYITDVLTDVDFTEQNAKWLLEDEVTKDKFSKPITVKDDYRDHLYTGRVKQGFDRAYMDDSSQDYRDYAMEYPLSIYSLGAEYCHHIEDTSYYRFDEMFKKGMDCEYYISTLTGSDTDMKAFNEVDVQSALMNVFGYD